MEGRSHWWTQFLTIMPPCYCRHANCNGTNITDNKHRKHRLEDKKVTRAEAQRTNRLQAESPSNAPSCQPTANPSPETPVPTAETNGVGPTLGNRNKDHIWELYQALVAKDTELHEHLCRLADTATLPANRLPIEEVWFK